ncbi:MAG: hypothetical protein Q9159_002681 [Coniocarpon cinnabarinum]
MNVNMPRASHLIGRKLSTARVVRLFCYAIYATNIRPSNEAKITLTPPKELKTANARERITKEQAAMYKTRTQGLTWFVRRVLPRNFGHASSEEQLTIFSRWATYVYFRRLHNKVRSSPNRWLGLFTCAVPSKLLRPPLSNSQRKLLLALASQGAKLDSDTLAHEEAELLWRWAASERDLYILQCLMEPRFAFRPNRNLRLAALREANWCRDVAKLFRQTRSNDSKSSWRWPQDWKKEWPVGDPVAEVELCRRHGVEIAKLEEFIDATPKQVKDWRVGFGANIPLHTISSEDESCEP